MGNEKTYGLIGFPLGHSFSQDFFNKKFAAENINAQYRNFELSSISQFGKLIGSAPGLSGLNVTIPYKEQIIPLLNELDEEAAKVGAVNVVKFIRRNGKLTLKGFNSDVIGFRDSIRPLLGPEHKRALILGTGGASKAVDYVLKGLGRETQLVSRTASASAITYAQLTPEIMAAHLVVVNTTPLGMYPHVHEAPEIPYHLLTPQHICYDLLYNPDVTMFMKLSSDAGAKVKNGLEMLLLQAFASWQIWQK